MSAPAFTKSNLRGSFVFLFIIVVVFVLPDIVHHLSTEESFTFEELAPEEQKALISLKEKQNNHRNFYSRESRFNIPNEKFNPDTYTKEQWMALGLSDKQASIVVKFYINSNEDLKKIFVISDEFYALIKDSTVYENRSYAQKKEAEEQPERLKRRIDLNSASEEELLSINGVGPYFAKQIIWKREALGGFVSYEQLKMIKNVDDQKIDLWKNQSFLDLAAIKYININTATTEEFKAHPYISWNLANSLVKLRSQIGKYSKVEDVKKSVLMTDDIYEKLKNYLVI